MSFRNELGAPYTSAPYVASDACNRKPLSLIENPKFAPSWCNSLEFDILLVKIRKNY